MFNIPSEITINIDSSAGNIVKVMPSVIGHQITKYTFIKSDSSPNTVIINCNGVTIKTLNTQHETVILAPSEFDWVEV